LIAGLLIGIGIILPGVSGGVIAVILGIYDKIIFSINNFFEDKKNNTIFLLKLFVGIILGTILGAKTLVYFFNKYFIEVSYLFIGLILGTIPLLIKDYNKKSSDDINYYILVIVMLLSLFFSLIIKQNISYKNNSLISLFISGFLFAIGKVVPGISSSVLLNLVGKYQLYLTIFSNPIDYIINNFIDFLIILFGLLLGIFISLKIMSFLLKKYYSTTYSVIIGFVVGSVVVMYPGTINFPGIVIMLIGLVVSLGIPIIKR